MRENGNLLQDKKVLTVIILALVTAALTLTGSIIGLILQNDAISLIINIATILLALSFVAFGVFLSKDTNQLALILLISTVLIFVVAVFNGVRFFSDNSHNAFIYIIAAVTYLVLACLIGLVSFSYDGVAVSSLVIYIVDGLMVVLSIVSFILSLVFGNTLSLPLFSFLSHLTLALFAIFNYLLLNGEMVSSDENYKQVCPNCSFRETSADVVFCRRCGARLEKANSANNDSIPRREYIRPYAKVCPSCGYRSRYAVMKYCVKCGTELQPIRNNEQAYKDIPNINSHQPQPDAAPQPVVSGSLALQNQQNFTSPKEAAERLERIYSLLQKGLITQEEYEQKRAELIKYL
jgi:hypothetical protein